VARLMREAKLRGLTAQRYVVTTVADWQPIGRVIWWIATPSASAVGKRASCLRWARPATPTTMRWQRASSPQRSRSRTESIWRPLFHPRRIANGIRSVCALNLTAATLRPSVRAMREIFCRPANLRRSLTSGELHSTLFFRRAAMFRTPQFLATTLAAHSIHKDASGDKDTWTKAARGPYPPAARSRPGRNWDFANFRPLAAGTRSDVSRMAD